MKFTVDREKLNDELKKVVTGTEDVTTHPILANVLLAVKESKLTLVSMCRDQRAMVILPVEAEEEGDTTLPAKKLGEMVGVSNGEKVKFTKEPGAEIVKVSVGKSHYRLTGQPAVNFPPDQLVPEKVIKVDKIALKKALGQVSYAISKSQGQNYMLDGVCFIFSPDELTLVATDGRRMAVAKCVISEGFDSQDLVVPSKSVAEILKSMSDEPGEVEIGLTEKRLSFKFDNVEIWTVLLIEAPFPKYQDFTDAEKASKVTIDRERFVDALSHVAVVLDDATLPVACSFTKDELTLRASSTSVGESKEVIEVPYQGDDITININPKFLSEPARNVNTASFEFGFDDERSPVSIKDGENFVYVAVPIA